MGRFLAFLIVTHASIIVSVSSSMDRSTPSTVNRMLPYRACTRHTPMVSAVVLSPENYRRRTTRPVSYYALFKGVAASKPTSWLSGRSNILIHLNHTWGP